MGCIHEFYELPTLQLVAGSTEPLVFYCWHEMTKNRYDVSGCTANFSIENYVNEEYVNDVKPSILTKPMTVDAANNAISVTLESFDTINIIPGEYIYQITLKDSLSGMVEIPHQGIIYIANNINKDFLLNGKYPTLFDISDATATADDIIYPKTAYGPNGKITGNLQTNSSSSIIIDGSTITIPAGYYPTQIIKTVTGNSGVTRGTICAYTVAATLSSDSTTLTVEAPYNKTIDLDSYYGFCVSLFKRDSTIDDWYQQGAVYHCINYFANTSNVFANNPSLLLGFDHNGNYGWEQMNRNVPTYSKVTATDSAISVQLYNNTIMQQHFLDADDINAVFYMLE